ncbi:MAG: alanine:cation symporter family protein [Proteobacteria bacterium]|nr:alanine:cation symporter family protein [Pseudomonadota bacterium]
MRKQRKTVPAERIGDRRQDTMGFTVVGPRRYLGSGHPDLRDELPPLLAAGGRFALAGLLLAGWLAVRRGRDSFRVTGRQLLNCAAIGILLLNVDRLPDMVALIFNSAFGWHAGFGAVLGLAIEWGVKRGIYSNEAGQGTGPHAAAAAEVSHPAKQGYVQAFSVYVDTLLVCSATAFLILSTGMYNVVGPDGAMLVNALPGVEAGPGFAQAAVESVLPGWGAGFVALALLFFAFTTILAYYYMAETNIAYINRKVHRPWLTLALRVGILAAVAYGAVKSAALAWGLGDIGVGLMAWLNLIAILILQKPAFQALRDYEAQKKAGRDPVFDPDALGIRNAELWREKLQDRDG